MTSHRRQPPPRLGRRQGLHQGRRQGFTLIELLIVVAIAVLLITLAAPSVRELLAVQRLQGIHATLVTDLQFARSEAARRRRDLILEVSSDTNGSCYVIFADAFGAGSCDCRRPAGSVCSGAFEEVRTVQVPRSSTVALAASSSVSSRATFEKETGYSKPGDFTVELEGQTRGRLRVTVNPTGRASSCSPDGSIQQVPRC
ncbi:MAG: Tfp pilus assembly protein FimT/FimU [Rubrivivax sp.]